MHTPIAIPEVDSLALAHTDKSAMTADFSKIEGARVYAPPTASDVKIAAIELHVSTWIEWFKFSRAIRKMAGAAASRLCPSDSRRIVTVPNTPEGRKLVEAIVEAHNAAKYPEVSSAGTRRADQRPQFIFRGANFLPAGVIVQRANTLSEAEAKFAKALAQAVERGVIKA